MAIEIGQLAPDFELPDQNRQMVRLSGFRGTPVLLVFYPFTFTPICHGELCSLDGRSAVFTDQGVQVLAVSCDAGPSQARWAQEQDVSFPLLSDFWPHGAVAQAYGVFNDAIGVANRATFLIDAGGIVADRFESADLGTARDDGRYDEALGKLGADV
jgi:mycoredoxin-dependent peroxiredoxin